MASELKPCPFCGGEAELREQNEVAIVQCMRRSMHRMLYGPDNNASEEAIREWNRRPREVALNEAGEVLSDRIADLSARLAEAEECLDALCRQLAELDAMRSPPDGRLTWMRRRSRELHDRALAFLAKEKSDAD